MKDEEWDACTEPNKMFEFFQETGENSDRKMRLFATGVVRQVWEMLAHAAASRSVELAERFADGGASEGELDAAWHHLRHLPSFAWEPAIRAAAEALGSRAARESFPSFDCVDTPRERSLAERQVKLFVLTFGVTWATVEAVSRAEGNAAKDDAGLTEAVRRHLERVCVLVRDIFGNPFRSLQPLSPSLLGWENGLVVKLAEAAYEHRSLPSGHLDNARLAVLGDALADAGCTDDWLLEHLRSEGPHARGCFAIDLLTGRK